MNHPDPHPNDRESVVTKSILVACDVAHAFRIWTEQIHIWWPAGHSRSSDPATQVLLEGKVGGRFYERTSQGIEHDWGEVIRWEPPHHLAYTWYLGSGPAQPTQVDVRFTPLPTNQTRIDVEHRGPELIGDLWWRNQARYGTAWEIVLTAYSVSGFDATPPQVTKLTNSPATAPTRAGGQPAAR
jgi:uncharacterized protein YndB with AHSA1/START domain